MDNRINARINALVEAVERRKLILEAPIDPLSQSLMDLADELSQLDALGKAALSAELSRDSDLDLTPDALDAFVRDYGEKPRIVLGRSTK